MLDLQKADRTGTRGAELELLLSLLTLQAKE
jgi:hypothetical protein